MTASPTPRVASGPAAWPTTAPPGAGSLYRTDPDGTVARVLDGLTIANGPAFTADGTTMYLADTAAGTILRCRTDPLSGDLLGSPETFAHLRDDEGSPDGMTLDAEGCLWVALWGAGAVRRHHPDGHLLHTLTVPAPHPTSVLPASRRQSPVRHHGPPRGEEPDRVLRRGAVFPAPVRETAGCSWRGRL